MALPDLGMEEKAAAMYSRIRDLIRGGESKQVEFKKTLPQPEKLARALVAFANSGGGTILAGVDDDGRITGIGDFEEEKYVLEKTVGFYCKPEVACSTYEVDSDGKTIMLIEIPESEIKPHYAIDAHGSPQLYVRSGSQCILASPLVAKAMQLEKEGRDSLQQRLPSRNEEALYRYLDSKNRITLKEYAKLINVSKSRASKILIGLTLSGKLFMHDLEKTIYFSKA
jgi:predicted HTH transcriptional regulator